MESFTTLIGYEHSLLNATMAESLAGYPWSRLQANVASTK